MTTTTNKNYLFSDPGAKERATPYLKPFLVEDPKLSLYRCQSRLRRSQSAPREISDRVRRKEQRLLKNGTKAMSHGSLGSDDVRYAGALSSQGVECGADGVYRTRKQSASSSHSRMETLFPADDAPPSTKYEQLSHSSPRRSESLRTEKSPKTSTRRAESLRVQPTTKKATLRSRTSEISLPAFCQNCGEVISFAKSETLSISSDNSLVCPNCGMEVRSVSGSSGSSLPGTPCSKRKDYDLSSDSQKTDTLSNLPSERSRAANGSIKLPEPEINKGDHHANHEIARTKAKQIYHRDGYKKEDVAAELSKK